MSKNYVFFFISMFVFLFVIRYVDQAFINPSGERSANFITPDKTVDQRQEAVLSSPSGDLGPVAEVQTQENLLVQTFILESARLRLIFSNEGATIQEATFFKKEDHQKNIPFKIIEDSLSYRPSAFRLGFGQWQNQTDPVLYRVKEFDKENLRVVFEQDFIIEAQELTLRKTYTLSPNDYILSLTIDILVTDTLWSPNQVVYTLYSSPQVGALSHSTNVLQEYKGLTLENKIHKLNPKQNAISSKEPLKWLSTSSRYYTLAILGQTQDLGQFIYYASNTPQLPVLAQTQEIAVSKIATVGDDFTDTYFIYLGPRDDSYLNQYNQANNNDFGLQATHLERILGFNWVFGPISYILNFLLTLFYAVTGNWGIAIILLTIFVRIAIFPFSYNMLESQTAIARLQPKLQILKDQHKDDPIALNTERSRLYKEEGIKLGCLGFIIQILVFFSLFSLFRNQFEFKHAVFIPSWITDLAEPDSIFYFGNYFIIPLVGWDTLRVLPFINLAIQLISNTFMMASGGAQNMDPTQRKFLMVGFAFMIFFFTYQFPSGLSLYLISSGILGVLQNIYIKHLLNKKMHLVKE